MNATMQATIEHRAVLFGFKDELVLESEQIGRAHV